jgi:hypothetical protein
MSKQILKGVGAATLVGVLAVLCVPAQAATVKANVPFSFAVNKKVLPPGTYTVNTSVANGLSIIGYRDGAMTLSIRTQSAKVTSPKLVFHRYGDEYILREVWTEAGSGFKLPESRRERELAGGRNGATTASLDRVEIPIL